MPDSPSNPEPREERPESPRSPGTRAAAIDVTAARQESQADEARQTALAALREAALRATGVLPQPALPTGEQPRFWLRRGDQIVVAALLALATGLMGVHWVRLSDWGRRTVEVDRLPAAHYIYKIDITRATWVEWAQFDGIGETLARRIVADRDAHGPFTSVDDVLRVRGIGKTRFDAMRRHLQVGPPASASP